MKKVIEHYSVYNRTYYVAKHNTYYVAIDYRYIDENGKLTKPLNGLQCHCSQTLANCLEYARNTAYMEYLENDLGYTKASAFARVFGLTEEQAQMVLAL